MQNELQTASSTPVAAVSELPSSVKSTPVELDLAMLQHVVGGAPNSNWGAPNSNWGTTL